MREDLSTALGVLPGGLDLGVGRVGLDCDPDPKSALQKAAEAERTTRRTNLDLPGHPVAVLLPAPLLHHVVLLKRALERILQVGNLEFPRVETLVALRTLPVRLVELEYALPDLVRQTGGLVRELGELSGGVGLRRIVGRGEAAGMEFRDAVDVRVESFDVVLNRLDLYKRRT